MLKSTPALKFIKTGKVISVTSGSEQTYTLFIVGVLHVFFKYKLFLQLVVLNYGDIQCWGKLLLKVMHNNIALLPKKVTNYVT